MTLTINNYSTQGHLACHIVWFMPCTENVRDIKDFDQKKKCK